MKSRASAPQACDELWIALAARGWRSVALVPATPRGSTAELAAALAEAGERLGGGPVEVAPAPPTGDGSEEALAELARRCAGDAAPAGGRDRGGGPERRLVVSLPSLLDEPRALALSRAADAVVVIVELGRTRLDDARRTVELIDPERLAGCLLVTR